MSYDLFFTEPEITLQQFESYFSDRNHYKIEKTQAWYENEDTGVYFCFDYSDEPEEDPEAPSGNVSFNLNLFRPHFFAIEAEPEVLNFVKHFNFKIEDPQTHGMGEGKYNTEGFLRGWNHGNEFGYNAIMSAEEPPKVIQTRPGDEIESIWRWNYTKPQTQDTFGEDVFVPRIMFIQIDGSVQSVVVWPDAIPALIPQVDSLVIPRQELAPRRFFKKKEDMCIVSFAEALSVLDPFRSKGYAMPAFALSYTTAPDDVTDFVKDLKPNGSEMEGIAMDKVLNQELVEKLRKG